MRTIAIQLECRDKPVIVYERACFNEDMVKATIRYWKDYAKRYGYKVRFFKNVGYGYGWEEIK